MKKYDSVIAGYLCVDLFPEFSENKSYKGISEVFIPGKLVEIEGISFNLGGLVANTGLAMKKFNKNVLLNGLVGEDIIGRIALERLDKHKLSEGISKATQAGTAFSLVIAPPGIDRIFLEFPGCNKIFDQSCIDFEAVSRSRLFHFGYPPLLREFYLEGGKRISEMFSRIQEMGVITSLDFSLPDPESESGKLDWPAFMNKILSYTDIFVPGLEEALQIMDPGLHLDIKSAAGEDDIIDHIPVSIIQELGRKIIDSGVEIVLIKAGHRGACLITGDVFSLNARAGLELNTKKWDHCEIWCDAYKADPLKIKNSSGAGDTAAAAFLTAILNAEDPDSAIRLAAMAGRNSLYCSDFYNDLTDWQVLIDEIRGEKNDLVYL